MPKFHYIPFFDDDVVQLRPGLVVFRIVNPAVGTAAFLPLEGAARLRIPPGTQTGQRFRLRGHGAPSTRNGMRGDLIVEVRIMLPRLLDERSKELLREFGKINAEPVRE